MSNIVCNLSDVIEYISRGITPKYTEGNDNFCIVLNQKCIRDYQIDFLFSRKNDLKKRNVSDEKVIKKYDILVNSTGVGTLGRVAQYLYDEPILVTVDSHITIIRPNSNKIDPLFLGYLIKSKQSLIESFAMGSTGQTELSRHSLNEMQIEFVSDLSQQKQISEMLFNIDKKIQLNTQINQTLEQIAQATFKSWFIDFDPVHAKANALANGETEAEVIRATMEALTGKPSQELDRLQTENPTAYEQFHTLAQAFPSEFEDVEEYGKVPKGWEIVSITDKRVCKVLKPKINLFAGEKDYIATANVSGNSVVGTLEKITYEKRPSRANMQPIIDSIWFAKMVGEHKAIMIDKNDDFLLKNTILSTGFLGIKPEKNKKSFLYCFINNEYFIQNKNQLATGAVQIALNNTSFSKIEIILPSDEILKFFEDKISDLFSTISQNQRNSKLLAEIRDLLLPKLLNGEV